MNVIIFGASGGIGRWAVAHALEKGWRVTAYVRDPQKLTVEHERLRVVQGEISDQTAITAALHGQDGVVWCVGIPMTRHYEKMASLEGHRNLLIAMEKTGVCRLVDWGTPSIRYSGDTRSLITVVPGIMAGVLFRQAKEELVAIGELLKASDVEWTLVRFVAPKNGPRTGVVKVGFGAVKMSFSISRADIGAFMVDQLESRTYIRSMPIIGS